MKKIVVNLCVLMIAVFAFSCDESSTTPSNPQTPSLTVQETNIGVALSSSRYITISGGKGNYYMKATTDSSVVSVSFYSYYVQNGVQYGSATLNPLKLGTAVLTIQDSAKSAEVKITVTVSIMATIPSSMTIRVGRINSLNISGGTLPYTIQALPNPSIATIELSSSYAYVTAVSAGATSVTFKDNANPPHTVTVPIDVTPILQFTSAGKISFSSGKGNFSANGIAAQDISLLPANSEGAGCWIYSVSPMGNIISIAAYRKKSINVVDIISISFPKTQLTTGIIPFDTTYEQNTAAAVFVFDGDLKSPTADVYQLTNGSVDVSLLNSQSAKGTFYGNAVLTRGETIFPGMTTVLSDGLFEVPVILDNLYMTVRPIQDKRVKSYIDKVSAVSVKKMLAKMKKR